MHIFLIRHASAGKRSAVTTDAQRELDDLGHTQAKSIARALSVHEIDHIFASPAVRCMQTVEPLAAELGLEVDATDALWEGRGASQALSLVQRLMAANSTAALCTHGDVIPRLLELLAQNGNIVVDHRCAKGSVWAVSAGDGQPLRAVYMGVP